MAEEVKKTRKSTKKVEAPKEEAVKEAAPKAKRASKKVEAPVEEVSKVEISEKEAKKASKKAEKEAKKAEKAAKKAAKEEVKPVRTCAKASALSVKVTPRKARLVIDLVRGKDVDEALAILSVTHKKAAPIVKKVIASAYANATNNFGMDGEKLYVAEIMASDSIKMKRYLPRAKGSASGMVKRFANIYVTLRQRD